MRRFLLAIGALLILFIQDGLAQRQVVNNGDPTQAVNFAGAGCVYNWTNDTPGIGLAASGTGNINAFTAINNGNAPIIATIKATSIPVQYAYIPGSNGITVINTSTNNVVTAIPAGYSAANVAATPDGSSVYISDPLSNSVLVINTSTNTIMATIPVGVLPGGITVTPDGKTVFVGNYDDNSISVISVATNKVTAIMNGFDRPFQLRAAPVGNLLYVLSQATGNTWVVNTNNNTIVATLPLIGEPWDIAINADGTRLYIAGASDNSVHVFNAATYAAIATISVGLTPENITISPDGSSIYVSCLNAGYVSMISTATNTVTKNISMPFGQGLSVSADGKTLYAVDNYFPGSLNAIDIATGNLITAIPTGYGGIAAGNFLAGVSCAPVNFTVTVNPAAPAQPTVITTPVIGSISACVGTASASPELQQFTISGSNLIDNISATVPSFFEISTSPNSGFGSSVTLMKTGGTVNPTTVYIRSSATAKVGIYTGPVSISSVGWITIGQGPIIYEMINALPIGNNVPDQARNNGQTTNAVNFTGTGNTFTWTNDMPGIGLAASGIGNIASFTAINTGTTPVKATVTVTPISVDMAYIVNFDLNSVSVINTVSNTIVSTIPVGTQPFGITITPDGTRAYVTNTLDEDVSVIDIASQKVIKTINVGTYPTGITTSPDGSTVYVTNANSQTLSVINVASNTVTATITVSTGPEGVYVSPDSKTVYVTNLTTGIISVIDAASKSVTASIQLLSTGPQGGAPNAITGSPDGKLLYISKSDDGVIAVMNTTTYAIVATIPVGSQPNGIALNSDGSLLYVANFFSNTVSVVSTATNSVIATVNVGVYPQGISVSSDDSKVYVTNHQGETVSVIDTKTNTVSANIPTGSVPISFGNFILHGTGCTGVPFSFTITVNPAAASTPTITPGPVTGTISACAGTASVSPQIQQFTVSGSNLTDNITATAPTDFEVSLSPGSGYGPGVMLTQTGGTAAATVIYVRASATATTGSISGRVTLTSAAATQNVVVNGVVNALPIVNTVGPKTAKNGVITTPINFTGTGNTFTWTNDTPGIGLVASGTSGIPAFTAVNTTAAPITATITVTPASSGAAYVSNYGSGTVSVINTTTNQLEKNIPVDKNPWGVAISPDGSKVYVTNQGTNSVWVIDAATNTITAKINVGMSPEGVVISPDGHTLYVADNTGTSLSVINTTTNAVSTITVGASPQGLAISPDGTKLYVANATSNTVSVVNTANNNITTVNVGSHPFDVAVSPDGAAIYVTNLGDNNVSVINASTHSITTVPVGTSPGGLCISPDGSRVYVANGNSKNISVINTADNSVTTLNFGSTPDGIELSGNGTLLNVTSFDNGELVVMDAATGNVVSTVAVGQFPAPIGNFIRQGTGCPGMPGTFTITVSPSPVIIVGQASGSITACEGSASATPNIQQFTVSANNLTNDITLDAPIGFEISLSSTNGYNGTLTLPQTGGTVGNTVVYVRTAASAPAGTLANTVQLTSPGAANQTVEVAALVNPTPTVDPVNSPTFINAISTTPIVFTGTGTTYSWTNSNPAIGLPASGTGDIPSFSPVNTGNALIIANLIVNAQNASGCPGTPATFTITVTPTPIAAISTSGALSPLTTTYGTPSPPDSFLVSGTALTGGVLVTPPAGFEVSTDNTNFSPTVTVGSGTFSSTPVYIRLAATTPVSQNGYSGNIVLTNAGAPPINVPMPLSTVTPAPLTIFADDKGKIFDTPNPFLTASYIGFVNNEGPSFLTGQPVLNTTAVLTSPPGQYLISISGASSPNYAITTFAGMLTIQPAQLVVPNTFTPNGDGINDTWNINFLNTYATCTVDIFTRWGQKIYTSIGYGIPWDGTYKGSALPIGTYYYIINLKNGASPLSGFVALIR